MDHWSPTYATLQAQLHAMIKHLHYLGVLPLPKFFQHWRTPLEIQSVMSGVILERERVVCTFDFHAGVPLGVWGRQDKQQWRSQDITNRASLWLSAVSISKLLFDHLHERKMKDKASRLAPYTALRENNRALGNVCMGIMFLLNEFHPEVPFEQYNFGAPDLSSSQNREGLLSK